MNSSRTVKNTKERRCNVRKVILSADSTCDLSEELKQQYEVNYFPFHIILEGEDYLDNITITPEKIYEIFRTKGVLPKTAAINVSEYMEYFSKWVEEGYEVIHICLGSAISSAYQNCLLAAQELSHISVIDSCNLSTGMGLLVVEAGKMIEAGMERLEIESRLKALVPCCHSSFLLDRLDFMHAGGRCSAIAMYGSNFLKIRPCIEVNNQNGSMQVGKKYRGTMESALKKYIRDKISEYPDIRTDKIFITHSGIDEAYLEIAKEQLRCEKEFKNIYITKASCTISSHCGPNTIGILFMT